MLRPDDYELQVLENWNQHRSTELRGDRLGRSLRTRTVAVSRNVEGSLQAAMEYLQDTSKRIQKQFYKC